MYCKLVIFIILSLLIHQNVCQEDVKEINLDQERNEAMSGKHIRVDEEVSLRLTKENFDQWSKEWRSGKTNYMVFVGADSCDITQKLKPIWNQIGDYLIEKKSDIKLAHLPHLYEHVMGKKELDIIGTPTIYLFKDGLCYIYSWNLEQTFENFIWFLEDGLQYYPTISCPYFESSGFTTIRIIQDAYIIPYFKYQNEEDFRLKMQIIFGVLAFGLVYQLIVRRKP